MKHLEIYGDSILKGVMYIAEQGRYRLWKSPKLEQLVQEGYAIENHSRMGATIERGIASLERHGKYAENTTVVLEYGGNDCDYDWSRIAEDPHGSFLPHIPEQTFMQRYRYAVELARSKGAEVVLLPLVPIDAKKYFSWISRDKNADNILQWLGDVSMLSRWQEHYSRLVEGLAEELRCPIIDIRRDFLLSHQFETLLCSDGIHPTPAGHEMIAERLAGYLRTA